MIEYLALGMIDETPNKRRTCIICGTEFIPHSDEDDCCSPVCRTIKRTKDIEDLRKSKQAERCAKLDALKEPPKFNLSVQPNARAEWFMSLPDDYKIKFYRFLTPHDLEKVKSLANKRLADDRFYGDCYVKNGKVFVSRSAASEATGDDGEAEPLNIPNNDDAFFDA